MTGLEKPVSDLAECCLEWSLSDPQLQFESPLAHLYRVTLPSGKSGALKLFTPQGLRDEWKGAQLLAWYGGIAAVEVIGLGNAALLMNWLEGDNLMHLFDEGRENEAAVIAAKVVEAARNQAGPYPALDTIHQRFDFLFSFPLEDIALPFLNDFQKAVSVATRMLKTTKKRVPLHGDLHFRNVLQDGTEWRLIDPKGVAGPPAYDLANLFINPWDRPEIVLAKGRAANLAKLLEQTTGHPAREILGWGIAHAAIAGAWNISNGGSGHHPLHALKTLLHEYDTLART